MDESGDRIFNIDEFYLKIFRLRDTRVYSESPFQPCHATCLPSCLNKCVKAYPIYNTYFIRIIYAITYCERLSWLYEGSAYETYITYLFSYVQSYLRFLIKYRIHLKVIWICIKRIKPILRIKLKVLYEGFNQLNALIPPLPSM